MNKDRTVPGDWYSGTIPGNVAVEDTAYVETTYSFYFFRSQRPNAVQIGRGAAIYLGTMFDVGPKGRVTLGKFALVHGARIICDAEVRIGDYALISWNVVLMDTYRVSFDLIGRRRELARVPRQRPRLAAAEAPARPIIIERNVWIGFDTCVLPGITIGEGSVVGARSVVAEDVAPFTVVAGNPARVVRQLQPAAPLAADCVGNL